MARIGKFYKYRVLQNLQHKPAKLIFWLAGRRLSRQEQYENISIAGSVT